MIRFRPFSSSKQKKVKFEKLLTNFADQLIKKGRAAHPRFQST
jgi:hypothetical protein